MEKKVSKFTENKIDNALKEAIKKEVECYYRYRIENNVLYINMDSTKLYSRDSASNLKLPSLKQIFDTAKQIYKKFRNDNIVKICYIFGYATFNGRTYISPEFCDVIFTNCDIYGNLFVYGGNSVEIKNCRFEGYPCFDIWCGNIRIKNTKLKDCARIFTKSDEINVEDSILTSINNIDITSPIMVFDNADLKGLNIELKCDLIDTKNTTFKADYDFNINCRYNEEVNGIDAERIIYNKVDITNSDNILRQKLLKKLIDDLKNIRDVVTTDIKNDLEEINRIHAENLNKKAIIKILNRNNK